jgi:hypothetical protein
MALGKDDPELLEFTSSYGRTPWARGVRRARVMRSPELDCRALQGNSGAGPRQQIRPRHDNLRVSSAVRKTIRPPPAYLSKVALFVTTAVVAVWRVQLQQSRAAAQGRPAVDGACVSPLVTGDGARRARPMLIPAPVAPFAALSLALVPSATRRRAGEICTPRRSSQGRMRADPSHAVWSSAYLPPLVEYQRGGQVTAGVSRPGALPS